MFSPCTHIDKSGFLGSLVTNCSLVPVGNGDQRESNQHSWREQRLMVNRTVMSVLISKQIGEHERCRATPTGYGFWFGRHGMEREIKALALCKSGGHDEGFDSHGI